MRAHPALVLNADFQPLSYFPLSLMPWGRAVKAVVEATHCVVKEYDTVVRSPSIQIRLPSVLALSNTIRYPGMSRSRGSTCFCAIDSAASIAGRRTRAPSSRSIM